MRRHPTSRNRASKHSQPKTSFGPLRTIRLWSSPIYVLGRLFEEFRRISALCSNIAKTIFIPLSKVASPQSQQTLTRELCPYWRDISIKTSGIYFGFLIEFDAGDSSWQKPLQKYLQRAAQWSSLKLGLFKKYGRL